MTGAEGAEGAVGVDVLLVGVTRDREDGGAGEEVRAGPGHSGFLFLTRAANLEFITSYFTLYRITHWRACVCVFLNVGQMCVYLIR